VIIVIQNYKYIKQAGGVFVFLSWGGISLNKIKEYSLITVYYFFSYLIACINQNKKHK